MIRIGRYDIFCSKGFAFMTVEALAESVANPKSSLTADSASGTSGISSGTPTWDHTQNALGNEGFELAHRMIVILHYA